MRGRVTKTILCGQRRTIRAGIEAHNAVLDIGRDRLRTVRDSRYDSDHLGEVVFEFKKLQEVFLLDLHINKLAAVVDSLEVSGVLTRGWRASSRWTSSNWSSTDGQASSG